MSPVVIENSIDHPLRLSPEKLKRAFIDGYIELGQYEAVSRGETIFIGGANGCYFGYWVKKSKKVHALTT